MSKMPKFTEDPINIFRPDIPLITFEFSDINDLKAKLLQYKLIIDTDILGYWDDSVLMRVSEDCRHDSVGNIENFTLKDKLPYYKDIKQQMEEKKNDIKTND